MEMQNEPVKLENLNCTYREFIDWLKNYPEDTGAFGQKIKLKFKEKELGQLEITWFSVIHTPGYQDYDFPTFDDFSFEVIQNDPLKLSGFYNYPDLKIPRESIYSKQAGFFIDLVKRYFGMPQQQNESEPQKQTREVTTQPEGSKTSFQNNKPAVNDYENTVFVSYAWGGESEHTVDELEKALKARSIPIERDKKDIDYKESIEKFEQRLARGQYIVLVISDKYLRSKHCMYELLEIEKNKKLLERIFPIVLPDAQFFEPEGRLRYIQYWEEKREQLEQDIKKGQLINLASILADLEKYADIRAKFDQLTHLISDINVLTPAILAANDFSKLIGAVERVMVK